MLKYLIGLAAVLFTFDVSAQCVNAVNAFEIGAGWRRDSLNWDIKNLEGSALSADVDDHLHFKDINFYVINAKYCSCSSEYYFRASADYGTSYNGRAYEKFELDTPLYDIGSVVFHTSEKIKRRSEAYDFSGAVGYPFMFCCCRLMISPLIGFSWHRQHIRSKNSDSKYGSSFVYDTPNDSSFYVKESSSSNPFGFSYSSDEAYSDPFDSPSPVFIPSELGLSVEKRTSPYRFTWYGFFAGVDIAYALDSYWTIISQTEFHFLDRCHRKRKSLTGIYFVDDYHKESYAYGFDQKLLITYDMGSCYYTSLGVEYKYWRTHKSSHDMMWWNNVAINWNLGFAY